jgi:GTPase SAR1 family protein
MENIPKFFNFKKLLIFGCKGVGKTTLTSALINNAFIEEEPSKEGK